MPERLECEVLQKVRYINTLTYLLLYLWSYVILIFLVTSFSLPFSELSLVGSALDVVD